VAQRYHVHTYTQEDGLPSSLVWDVLQDATGRMWFATRTGIAVYDGAQWRTFHQTDGLAHPEQAVLALDANGILWSASPASLTLSRWDGERWNTLPPVPRIEDRPLQIGSLATGDWGAGDRIAVGLERHGLVVGDGATWRHLGPQEGLAGEVLALGSTRGGLLVGTEAGLYRLQGGRLEALPLAFPTAPADGAVRGLAVESLDGGGERVWLAGQQWIATLEGPEGTALTLRHGALNLAFPTLADRLVLEPDRQDGIFFGNALGLARLDGDGVLETLGATSGLVTQGVTSMFLDRERHLWVGSGRGVTKIVSFRFANFDAQHGLLENEVSAILERAPGELVLGHERGLTILRPDRGEDNIETIPLHREGLLPNPRQRVLDLAQDREGNLWVAGGAMGLCRLDRHGTLHWVDQEAGIHHGGTVLVDRQGQVWAATSRQLFLRQGDRFVPVAEFQGIRRLFETRDGTLYMATERGLYRGRGNDTGLPRWSRVPGSEGLNVYAFLEDRQGHIWFGTGAGPFHIQGERAVAVTAPGPATERPVYFLVQDPQDRLWLGTDNGVLRWDGRSLNQFTVSEGLSGRETNRAAGVVDSRGRLWIGTDQGVSLYRHRFDHPGRPPRVELPAVVAGTVRYPLTGSLSLAAHENDLVFPFRALSFQDEKRILFQSWLEGYEEDWLPPFTAPHRELRYTSLAPGTYRLHLRAASAEGIWSEPVISASIVIAPPVWQRPWFYLSVGLLGALALLGVQRHVAQRRYAAALEAEVARRTEALATLSREKGEFLAIAAHDLRVPLVNLRGFTAEVEGALMELMQLLQPAFPHLPEKERARLQALVREDLPEELSFIDASAVRMDRLVTAILNLSRLERRELHPEPVAMDELVRSILDSLAYRLEQHPATVEVGPLPTVTADPIAMEQVLQNLLANAVAYLRPGHRGQITVRATAQEDHHVFSISDNGRGIAAGDREKVFQVFGRGGRQDTPGEGMGLAYVRTLLRRHGGRVWFESQVDEGTTFYFALPRSTSPP
jgi:signal transduction histidine kinase/ligand-binding sensor domain-containing protein